MPDIRLEKFEASTLRSTFGALVVEVGRITLHRVVAGAGFLEAGDAELADVKVHGPLALPALPRNAPADAWQLGPLAAANGTIRAEIVDAQLLFDAKVTVPIRDGRIDFNQATVEHVGPDSRMGVSRMGLYVDAPNGRSYLYQFPSAAVAGVEYERRGAMLGARVSHRGSLHLQPFVEGLLRQSVAAAGTGLTQQARLLFQRTAVSGDVRLSDGKLAAPGMQAELTGRAEGRNTVRVHAESVGRGLTAEVPSLSVREARVLLGKAELACGPVSGAATLRLQPESGALRFVLDLPSARVSGVRITQTNR